MLFKCVLVELFLKHGICHNIHGEKHPRLLSQVSMYNLPFTYFDMLIIIDNFYLTEPGYC